MVDWTVGEVVGFARGLGFADAVCTAFGNNLVNGEMICGLTEDELKDELGLRPLQIKRFRLELAKLEKCECLLLSSA